MSFIFVFLTNINLYLASKANTFDMNLTYTSSIFRVVLFSLLCTSLSFSQEHSECGFEPTEANMRYFQELKRKSQALERKFLNEKMTGARTYTTLTSLPIKAHIVRKSDGSGGLTESQLNNAIATMNSYYSNAGLEFFLCDGINYINNSNFYELESNEESSLTSANNINNVINIYFLDKIYNSSGSSLCGYAYYPGGPETIMMANGCATNGSTLSHEMGHFFGLFHTHGNNNTATSSNELVNGSNCDNAGDYICDTPADPTLSYSNVNTSCEYTGNDRDANNDLFDPQTENIMSYSRRSCRTLFTETQYARINATYELSRSNLRCPDFYPDFSADITESCDANLTVNFTESSEGAVGWSWDVNGDGIEDYSNRNITHTYTSPGDFDVTLTITNGSTSISKVKYNYIDVGADEIDTSEITLYLTLDNWPSETSWEFSDSNGNLIASGGPYQEGQDDNTTKVETFSVNPGLCYNFQIFDAYGDGICCSSGNGSYELRAADNTLLASGGDFGELSSDNLFNGNLLSVQTWNKEDIGLYPNPTSNELTIDIKEATLPEALIIYNAIGQRIMSRSINSQRDLTVFTEDFTSGLYFVKLQNQNGEITLPFVRR